jgi:hypothetical protein
MEEEGVNATVMAGFRVIVAKAAASGLAWLVAVMVTVCCGVSMDGAV